MTAPAQAPLEVLQRNPHLAAYLAAWTAQRGEVIPFAPVPDIAALGAHGKSLVYPLGEPLFVHAGQDGDRPFYNIIEPTLSEEGAAALREVRMKVMQLGALEPVLDGPRGLQEALERFLLRVVAPGGKRGFLLHHVPVPADVVPVLRYQLFRDVIGHGPLEPLLHDPYLEDIHAIGANRIFALHKVFGTCVTNVRFGSTEDLDEYLKNLSERVGRPVSESSPIVDATLDSGDRINLVYSADVSRKGPSFSLRRVLEQPISVTQLIQFGTMTATLAAYLWICLENGMNVWVCGETACGKTSSLNALLTFVPHNLKVFTAEDTPEVQPPHAMWQRLVTRDRGPVEGRVTMFDLLKAALRSRPNLIVVGEIRGVEGNVAFQAMQTGHACMATFHASSVGKLIQRLTSDPINVPATFLDNLNIAIIQMAVYRQGKLLRRVLAVEEIEGFNKHSSGVETRRVFEWDPRVDAHLFRGMNNSYILETKIAEKLGYGDRRAIYDDLRLRTAILQEMVRRGILDNVEVNKVMAQFQKRGAAGLPFPIVKEVAA